MKHTRSGIDLHCGSTMKEAFEAAIVTPRQHSERWYVCLMEEIPFFGGHEEGGWWGKDLALHQWAEFPSVGVANDAADRVEKLAASMTKDAKAAFGRHCIDSLDRAEARGEYAEDLPEVDGEEKFFVIVTRTLPPRMQQQSRHWE